MNPFRKILFYLFVLIYIFTCPVIILGALGIIITPGRQKSLMATGLISVDTIPQGASIYVNDRLYRKTSPAIVRDLPPGDYKIRITLDGHQPWQKTVSVEKQQAASLESILLVPTAWETQILSDQTYNRLIPSDGNPFFALQQNPTVAGLLIYRYRERAGLPFTDQEQTSTPLSRLSADTSDFSTNRVTSISSSPHSPFLLLGTEDNGLPEYLWIDTRMPPQKLQDITPLLGSAPEAIRWDSDDEDSLFYMRQQTLNRIDPKNKMLTAEILPDIKSYDVFNSHIFSISSDNQFLRTNYKRGTSEPLTGHLAALPPEFQISGRFLIHILTDNLALFLSDSGRLLTNKLPYIIIEKGAVGFSRELIDKRLIVWTRDRLGTIDFKKVNQEGLFEMGPRVDWLPVPAENIRQAFWVNKGTHILYVDRDQVKLVEAGETDAPAVADVVEAYREVDYSDESGELFYLDRKTRQLKALTILPEHPLISFKLPENFQKKDIR